MSPHTVAKDKAKSKKDQNPSGDNTPLAFLFLGDGALPAGLPLAPLGAPDCFAFTNANLTSATVPVTAIVAGLIAAAVAPRWRATSSAAVCAAASTPTAPSNGNSAR